MSNINLYQAADNGNKRKNKPTVLDSGFFWSVSILLVTLVLLGGSKLVVSNLKDKNKMLEEEITKEIASFAGGDLDRVVDFQTRVDEANKNVAGKFDMDGIFSAVEKSMVKGSSAVLFSYVKSAIGAPVVDLEIASGDFPSIAKQILSFKENQSFVNVVVKEIKRNESGISLGITANFK